MQSLNNKDFNAEFERQFYQKTAYQNAYEPVLYYVKPGDTLSQIITSYYDIRYGTSEYDYALLQVLYHNKHISNPDFILPRQVISLVPMTPRFGLSMCTESDAKQQDMSALIQKAKSTPTSVMAFTPSDSLTQQFISSIPQDPQEREVFWTLAWLQSNYDFLSTSAGAATNVLGGLTGEQSNALIREVDNIYSQYQKGALTKSQYDYKRQQLLKSYSQRVGPLFEKAVFNGQSTQQAIRINRTKALPANSNILKYGQRLNTLSKLASKGGLVLTGVGVAKGAYDMCQASSRHEKNEIFVETLGSTIMGIGLGLAVGAFLLVNPLSWGAVLVLGTAAAAGGYYAGKGVRALYNIAGDSIDLLSPTRLETICNMEFTSKKQGAIRKLNNLNSLRSL